jgi:hypothetical protein
MYRNFEAILPHQVHCLTDVLHGMSSFIQTENFIIGGLDAHFYSRYAELSPLLAIGVVHEVGTSFYR